MINPVEPRLAAPVAAPPAGDSHRRGHDAGIRGESRLSEQRGTPISGARIRKPSYFQTYAQITTELKRMRREHPRLVQLHTIGHSQKGRGIPSRPIYAVTLGNKLSGGDKPVVMYVGGVHSREIANPALLMNFADDLLSRYGKDPQVTALLDTRQIDIVPVLNPGGYGIIERAYARGQEEDLWQRKNLREVDLNRNFDFHWGGEGSSDWLPAQDYRGPKPASESETRALQKFIGQRRPDMFIDWHSYSELNLYPWGDTATPAPDEPGLKAIAQRFTTFNKYTTQPAFDLYPTTGTTDDYVYGKLGVPSFTMETAQSFHPSEKGFRRVLHKNLPVLRYAARIAEADGKGAYTRVQGPETSRVRIAREGARDGERAIMRRPLAITAAVSDAFGGGQKIAAAEWTRDSASAPGTGHAMAAVDGAFDGVRETVRGPLSGPARGRSLIYVRAQDDAGNWGPARPQWSQPIR